MGRSEQLIEFNVAKKRLAILWFVFSAIIFGMFIFWTLASDKFGDKAADAWSLILPALMPTLSLIVGIYVADSSGQSGKGKKVSRFIYRLSFGLSLFYLMNIVLIIFLHGEFDNSIFTTFKKSNLFLGPLQGLVSAAIGAFYYKKE